MSLIMMTMGVGVMVMLLMRIHSRSWTKCPMAPTKHAEKNLSDRTVTLTGNKRSKYLRAISDWERI